MPTYEYECKKCGHRFEQHQTMKSPHPAHCPECGGEIRHLITGGAGFIFKNSANGRTERRESGCSLESSGTTCCGRDERCGKPPCGDKK